MAIRQPARSPDHPRSLDGARMPLAEYLGLPEDKPYLEYIDGKVREKPMPNANHGRTVLQFDFEFETYRRARGGDGGPERRVALADANHVLPDSAYWAPGVPSGDDSIPTIAVEVRSPSETLAFLRAKCRLYRASGVASVWLIDPERRTAEVFDATRDGVRVHGELTCEQAPGLAIAVESLWAAPR